MTLLKNPLLQRVLLLVIVYAAMAASVTNFGTTGNAYAILESSAMLGIVAAGLAVNMMAGELDLSVGSVAACAGLVAIMMSGHGLVIAIIAAVAPAVLYGILQGYAIARPMPLEDTFEFLSQHAANSRNMPGLPRRDAG